MEINVDYQILASIIYSIGYIVAVLMSCSYCDKAKKAGHNMEFQMFSFSVKIISIFLIVSNIETDTFSYCFTHLEIN